MNNTNCKFATELRNCLRKKWAGFDGEHSACRVMRHSDEVTFTFFWGKGGMILMTCLVLPTGDFWEPHSSTTSVPTGQAMSKSMSKSITFDVTHCFMTQLLLRPWRESQQSTTAPSYSPSRFVKFTPFVFCNSSPSRSGCQCVLSYLSCTGKLIFLAALAALYLPWLFINSLIH